MQKKDNKKLEYELLHPISKARVRILASEILNSDCLQKDFIAIIQKSEGNLAAKSSYTLCQIEEIAPEFVQKNISPIIKKTLKSENHSELRSLIRVLIERNIPEEYAGELLDKCYSILFKPKVPVAVPANAISLLYNISNMEPELKRELLYTLENLPPTESPAIKNRAGKTIKQLKKDLKNYKTDY